ncbi:phage tail protein I [Dysosmobacter sp.]|uniref:phage tail protein I n=1 Tax=Dysosmobacter sp. TaxID=2591382 RepID=UPI003A366969
MIKLSGSRFTDIMPENLASQVETKAFAYAVGRQIEKLCAYSDAARTYAAIATMPEWLLDYMAVELRTPSYDENYSLKTKRELIQGSLLFYTQMGTPAAVNRIIETIFETGYIEEWYEYDGDPHHFRAYVGDGGEVGPGELEEFRRVLSSVKRLSSWLDDIITITAMDPDMVTFTGTMGKGYTSTPLPEAAVDYHLEDMIRAGGTFGTITQTAIPAAI